MWRSFPIHYRICRTPYPISALLRGNIRSPNAYFVLFPVALIARIRHARHCGRSSIAVPASIQNDWICWPDPQTGPTSVRPAVHGYARTPTGASRIIWLCAVLHGSEYVGHDDITILRSSAPTGMAFEDVHDTSPITLRRCDYCFLAHIVMPLRYMEGERAGSCATWG
ncbi:hypothetical protein F5X98DRAFT_30552 [Xylaria grammica]|nr:hypothetical protein F5X98DRAFT_30552 [Xylaria grammica]